MELIRAVPCRKIQFSLGLNPFGDTVDGARLIISGNLLTVVLEVLQNLCTMLDGTDEHRTTERMILTERALKETVLSIIRANMLTD